jgi:hypothetical protein
VNPNWSCAVEQNAEFKLAEAHGKVLRTVLDTADSSFALGNPLVSDNKELILEWGGRHLGGIRFFAHNPTKQTISALVKSNSAFKHIPETFAKIKLGAGQSHWYWMGKCGGIKESPEKQVVKSVCKANINTVYFNDKQKVTLNGSEK